LPFYLHTGEYVQLHEAIKYFTENFSLEERNARIHDYLAIQNQRFAERLTLKRPDIFN
jgi:LytS/YehU family sensor histidine kinase